jgi:nucleotide-binding universal stress UspA family protein
VTETIVVGIDGSSGSWDALSWAAHEAVLRGASLEIVLASLPNAAATFYMTHEGVFEGTAQAVVDEARDRVSRELGATESLEVRTKIVHAEAVPALLEAAQDADLLVVGSRGHGAFAGMLLGSVSLHCASYAPCPVVIYRPKANATEG